MKSFQTYKIVTEIEQLLNTNYQDSKNVNILYNYHAAAAKSLQSCPTLCDPIDGSPPGSPVPGILQAGTLEWVAISFSNAWKWKVNVKSLSRVRLLATPWTAAHQAPPSMGFSRWEYWSGVPLPSPVSYYYHIYHIYTHIHDISVHIISSHSSSLFLATPMWCSIRGWYHVVRTSYVLFEIFYWHRVDLQHCASFRCTAKWIIYPFFFRFFSHIDYYRVLNRVLCYTIDPY